MKNLTKLMVVALVAGLTACASDEDTSTRNYRYAGADNGCGDALIKEKPAPTPVRQYQPATRPCNTCQAAAPIPAQRPCNNCQPTEYTVRTPVKVVYKNTTYHTVYEPRTYETTSFETRPFNRGEACATGNCIGEQVTGAQPVMNVQPVSGQPVVTRQPVLQQPAAQAPAQMDVYEK
ncbi:MAG: hypothetical protein MR350_03560 [Alphaproteobacteria bacterium]|nr:hypothetical protein [Alphaproteobacteria bacterium]